MLTGAGTGMTGKFIEESWKSKIVNPAISMNKTKYSMLEVTSLEDQLSTCSLRNHHIDVTIITSTLFL